MDTDVWSIADFVTHVYYPCVVIGGILPAGGAILSAMVRSIQRAAGFGPVVE